MKSGRCSGRGCGWRLRESSWRRDGTATGAWADGGSAEQRRRGGAGSSAPAERVKAAARVEGRRRVGGWVQGSRGGANKGQAGDLGDACLAEPRRRSRRFPLSARGMREEEGDADGWARAGRGGARARAGWRGADRLARLVSRVVERASRVVGRGRALLGRCVEKG